MEERVRAPVPVRAVERGAVPDRDEHVLEAVLLRAVIVDVAGRHDRNAHAVGERAERSQPRAVPLHAIVLELDEDVLRAERVEHPARERLGVGDARVERGEQRARRHPVSRISPAVRAGSSSASSASRGSVRGLSMCARVSKRQRLA
jgi:hypothetical protein